MSQNIGERIVFEKKDKTLRVEISGRIERWKETVLFAWGIAWTLCGLYIMIFFFGDWTMDEKIFLLIYLAFWAFFEYKVVNTWLWRKFGKEIIMIRDGELELKNDVLGYGSAKRFFVDNIENLDPINADPKAFSTVYNRSFWIIGGESVGFEYMGQKAGFGRQLEEKDAFQLAKLIKKNLK